MDTSAMDEQIATLQAHKDHWATTPIAPFHIGPATAEPLALAM